MMKGISVVIITKNEERNIERCLLSVKGIADEVVVVDSFSTDDTPEICREHDNEFVQVEWRGFSKTKNFGNKLARYDYILSLDADEALSEELKASILNAKEQGLNGIYQFNRLTNYCGKWIRYSGWYPDTKVRLFPKEGSKWKGDFVHEEITYDPTLPVHHLTGDLHHYSYYTEQEHRDRAEKYARLGAQKLRDKGETGNWFKAVGSAISRFFRIYVVRQGYRDGREGWKIATISARAAYLKYLFLSKPVVEDE